MAEAPSSSTKVTLDVYEGVAAARRPPLVGVLWASGALRVEALKADDGTYYTVTATFPA